MSDELSRLKTWGTGLNPDVTYCAGNDDFAKDVFALMQRCEKAERDLAACYRLSGADPNGNEDWRLAPGAIDAVEELRKDYDRTCSELERVERERDEAWRVLQAARPFAAQWTPLNYTQLANRKQALVEAFRIYDAVCAAAGGGLVDPLVAERERLAAVKAKGGRGE